MGRLLRYSKTIPAIAAVVVLSLAPAVLATGRFTIYTTNYPLQYFAQRVAGEHAEVVFPVPPDVDPAYWSPDQQTLAAYQNADLILLNGATYEKWIGKVSLPASRVVDTSKGFRDRFIPLPKALSHSHGAAGEHEHSDVAFTTWLDFTLAVEQAKAITRALGRKVPEQKAAFETNFAALEKDLLALDQEMQSIVAAKPELPLLGSHPVYQYLARRYGLNLRSVHWEPDEVPDDAQWLEMRLLQGQMPMRLMLWEGEPATESVRGLENMGIGSLVFDPCGNTEPQADFLQVMRRNAENLAAAYRGAD